MKLRLIATCLTLLSLTACERLKQLLPTDKASDAAAAKPGVCKYDSYELQQSQQEATALKAAAGAAERHGDTLTLLRDGKTIATVKDCSSFYTGTLNLKNPQSGQIEAYPTFSNGADNTVIVDPDGTPHAFKGKLVASPDGRYVASGEAHEAEWNAWLVITEWTSHSQLGFNVACSPETWATKGLKVSCDRTDPTRFFSDGMVTATSDGWQLQETKLNPVQEDPRQPFGPHEPDKPERFVSEISWPKDGYHWIDGGEIYRPIKGDAVAPRLPDITLSLFESSTNQLTTYKPATSTSNGVFYLLTVDRDHAYDIGKNPKASPDGRFLFTDTYSHPLIDWANGRTQISFEGLRCVDGVWMSATRLTAYCQGADGYVEGELTQAGDGTWTYTEISPVRLTAHYSWVRYKSTKFVARTHKGHPHDVLLNQVYQPDKKASS